MHYASIVVWFSKVLDFFRAKLIKIVFFALAKQKQKQKQKKANVSCSFVPFLLLCVCFSDILALFQFSVPNVKLAMFPRLR